MIYCFPLLIQTVYWLLHWGPYLIDFWWPQKQARSPDDFHTHECVLRYSMTLFNTTVWKPYSFAFLIQDFALFHRQIYWCIILPCLWDHSWTYGVNEALSRCQNAVYSLAQFLQWGADSWNICGSKKGGSQSCSHNNEDWQAQDETKCHNMTTTTTQ